MNMSRSMSLCALSLAAVHHVGVWASEAVVPAPTDVVIAAEEGLVFDRPVRYVNQQLITSQHVQQRMQENVQLSGRGRFPQDTQALEALFDAALLELTNEELLIQESERLGLSISRKAINEDVRKRVFEAGGEPTFGLLTLLADRQVRSTRIRTILHRYVQMAPSIRPADIETYYHEHVHQYRRPARWNLYQIMITPSAAAQTDRVFDGLLSVYRAVLSSQQAPLKDLLSEERIATFKALPFGEAAQTEMLVTLCTDIAAMDMTDAGALTLRVREEAARWQRALAAIRSRDQVITSLESVRTELAAIDDPAQRLAHFSEQARAISTGKGASIGGNLSYVEKDSQNTAINEQLLTLEVGVASPIVWFEGAAYVLFVSEKEEAVQRTFTETSGEILKLLEKRQRKAITQDIEKQLFQAASILDI